MWQIEDFDEYVRFTAPSGFKFEFQNLDYKDLLETLNALIMRGTYIFTRHSESLYVNAYGQVEVLKCDPWLNSEWELDERIASGIEFGKAILKYLGEQYERFNRSSSSL